MEQYKHQMHNYTYDIEKYRCRKNKKNSYINYCNDIMTFDIEVSSAWLENNKVIPYRKGESADYWNSLTPLALPYIWQFSLNDTVYYGRELTDFIKVLNDIPSDLHCIIWVHNLSYEFQFLCNLFEWDTVFARTAHKILKCVPKDFTNIEFRCSYMLTRLSLDTWGKQLKVEKATGDLDYDILRTPLTELTETELHYCEQDCLVVYAGIKKYLEKYKKQRNIPLTQTGIVRYETKTRLMCDKKYSYGIKKLVPTNAEEYQMLRRIFAGGYCHANRWYSGEVIKDYIEHYDFTSSYPTVMVAEKYPMVKWLYTGDFEIPPDEKFENYAYIMHFKFNQLNCKTYNTYIQASKCDIDNGRFDNGRVISADSLEIWCTEQDWLTIKNTYKWKEVQLLDLYMSRKEYLPKAFTEYILELYANKTELKGLPDKEELYMQSKQYINSLYGMSVTAIIQSNVIFKNDEWYIEPLTADMVNNKLDSLRFPNPRDKRYFLSFSWGCWVTAYARRNLWKCIEKCDNTMLYCDTDSIFVIGEHDFTWYNEEITDKLKKACELNGLDFQKTRPKTLKGIEKPLGIFDKEDSCCEFITLGAKRYVERRISDKQLHLTVSGINKGAVGLLNDNIENFTDGFIFDKDSEYVTKKLSTYISDMPMTVWNDGYVSTYTHGINLRRTGYELTMTDEYKELIQYSNMTVEDLPEAYINSLRGKFTI